MVKVLTARVGNEDVKLGDKVWAYDEKTGENDWSPVVKLFRNETKAWHHVFVDGEEIVCTGGHPFYVVGEGFVEAKNLKIPDKLLLSDGRCVTIEKLEVETLEKAETTYDFEVEDFHTYYVSESNVLVHNDCDLNERVVDTYDEAEKLANQHVGTNSSNYKGKSNIKVSKDGRRVARFDTDPKSSHVINKGLHINLETYEKPFGTKGGRPLSNKHLKWRKK